MNQNHLIKFTNHLSLSEAITFIGMLPSKEEIKHKDYRHYDFDRKKKMAIHLQNILAIEIDKLKEQTVSHGIEPSERWQTKVDSTPALTLLQSYFIFVKSYVESLVGFIALYLQDLEQRGINVGDINMKNKYKNLEKFNTNANELEDLRKIRNLSIHSKEEGDYNFAFFKNVDNTLEACLIEMEYNEDTPSENKIYYAKDLDRILQAANNISINFYNYTKNILNLK